MCSTSKPRALQKLNPETAQTKEGLANLTKNVEALSIKPSELKPKSTELSTETKASLLCGCGCQEELTPPKTELNPKSHPFLQKTPFKAPETSAVKEPPRNLCHGKGGRHLDYESDSDED